jgi:hypothetical protein
LKKREWTVVCPACDEKEVLDLEVEYTEKELTKKGLLIDNSIIISHCGSCRVKGKRGY